MIRSRASEFFTAIRCEIRLLLVFQHHGFLIVRLREEHDLCDVSRWVGVQ